MPELGVNLHTEGSWIISVEGYILERCVLTWNLHSACWIQQDANRHLRTCMYVTQQLN